MRHLHKPLLIATALVLLASSARAEDQTFSDGEFFIVDWTQAILINPSGTFTFTTERRATGGNPGAFRRITHDRVGGSGSSSVAHFRVGMVFDPSTDGAIETVDWQLEARVGAATSGGVGYGPLIRQGGLRFYAIGDVILTGTGWRPAIEFGLTANDFIAADGSAAKPDFSTSGGPIEFGFFSTNGAGNAGFSSASSVDNWNVTVHCDPDFQLPLFETGDLFGSAGQGTTLVRFDTTDPTDIGDMGSCVLSNLGIAFDGDGRLYATTGSTLRIYDRNFQLLGEVTVTDTASTLLLSPMIRSHGQLIACDRAANPGRLIIFDTTDPTNPVHTRSTVLSQGVLSSVTLARNGDLWLSASSKVARVQVDGAGGLLSEQFFSTFPTNPIDIVFQASTGRMFLSAVNANKIEVVDPVDPTTPLATITDICDGLDLSPLTMAFDSAGNLFVSCSNVPPQVTDVVFFPAASLQSLSGTVTAASLGAVGSAIPGRSGGGTLAFKPQGKSRDPFTIEAGANITILSADQSTTTLTGIVTSNPTGETIAADWSLNGSTVPSGFGVNLAAIPPLPVGDHVFTFEARGCCLTVRDTVTVTVENSPPTAAPTGASNCPDDENVILGGQVADFDGDALTYEWRFGMQVLASGVIATTGGGAPVTLPNAPIQASTIGVGVHMIELVVDDGVNDEVSASITVEVCPSDTTAPTCSPEPSISILWPPNHELVDVTIAVNAADDSGGPVTIAVLVSIDDADANADNTNPDIIVVDDGNTDGIIDLQLRSERAGQGDGRTYTVTITVTDEAGNSSSCEVEIRAPHSRGKNS